MRHLALPFSILLASAAWSSAPRASDVSLGEVWALVQQQQDRITALEEELRATKSALASTETKLTDTRQQVRITEEQLDVTADYITEVAESAGAGDSATSIGGYGELHLSLIHI